MQIELTDQEIKFISEALDMSRGYFTSFGEDDQSREFKALRLKIDSLIGATEETK